MIDDVVLNYIILFIVLELYEVQWQKAGTMMGMLARMYQHYARSIFLFLIMHPTFYLFMALMILTDYNIFALMLFVIKAVDIFMIIILIKQIFIDKQTTNELTLALLAPINKFLPYLGLIAYPPLIFLAMT